VFAVSRFFVCLRNVLDNLSRVVLCGVETERLVESISRDSYQMYESLVRINFKFEQSGERNQRLVKKRRKKKVFLECSTVLHVVSIFSLLFQFVQFTTL
jgi:hypothetical protein